MKPNRPDVNTLAYPGHLLHFIELKPFTRDWRDLRLDDDVLWYLQLGLCSGPKMPPVIQGTVRRVRSCFCERSLQLMCADKLGERKQNGSKHMGSFGKDIIDGLQGLADTLDKGEKVSEKFTCHKMVLNLKPTTYEAGSVRATRAILNASQSVFAQFLGVSVSTLQKWEQGDNPVTGAACRLMDEIRENPEYWNIRLRSLAEKKSNKPVLQ